MYADLKRKSLTPLSLEGQDIGAFDIVDRNHYVYAVRDLDSSSLRLAQNAAAIDETGQPLLAIAAPATDPQSKYSDRSVLWVARGGSPSLFVAKGRATPMVLFAEGQQTLRLSPDGRWLVTAQPTLNVPGSWGQRYKSPIPSSPFPIAAGPQSLDVLEGGFFTSEYVLVDFVSARVTPLVDGPTGEAAGWWTSAAPSWSPESDAIVLPEVFLPPADHDSSVAAPCVTIVRIPSKSATCLLALRTERVAKDPAGLRQMYIKGVNVDAGGRFVSVDTELDGKAATLWYTHGQTGPWHIADAATPPPREELLVFVKERFDAPPVLAVASADRSEVRVLWNPNPQLKDVVLGPLPIHHW